MYRRYNQITAEQQAYLRSREQNIVTPEQLGCQGSLEYRTERAAREKTMNFNLKQTVLNTAARLVRCLSSTEVRTLSDGGARIGVRIPDSCPENIRNLILEKRARKEGIDLEQRSRGGSRSTFVPPVETTVSNEGAIARAAERVSQKVDALFEEERIRNDRQAINDLF